MFYRKRREWLLPPATRSLRDFERNRDFSPTIETIIMDNMESLLIITGTMGADKTSVLGEASDILAQQGIAHAAIDLDTLGLAHFPSTTDSAGVMYGNLQSVCTNYASLGVKRVLLARAIEDRAELELCSGVVSASNTIVCRLSASIETMEQRVKLRESGSFVAGLHCSRRGIEHYA
jgi:hypothetical protein